MKILIVEDMAPVSKLLKLKLTRWGHQTRIAATGKAVMDILKQDFFDLILLDIFLPDAMAYDLIPQMKREWSGMEIITMTGHNSRDLEKRIRSQGILYYMVKPINFVELKSILSHFENKRDGLTQPA